jgi:hypothetical protein
MKLFVKEVKKSRIYRSEWLGIYQQSIFPLYVTIKKLSNTESFFIFTAIGAKQKWY